MGVEKLLKKFPNITTEEYNETFYILPTAKLFQAVEFLRNELDYNFLLDIVGVDYLEYVDKRPTRFAIIYHFRKYNFVDTLTLKVYVEDEQQGVESISTLYKAANWLEREVYDQYGIHFANHPLLKRILNHNEFIGHPLRRDYAITQGQYCTQTQDLMDELVPCIKSKGLDIEKDNLMVLNLGPSHPASHGTIRTIVALDGEQIRAAASEIGYLHRGFEKSCENHTYNQIVPYTDRLNYCSAIMNNIAFVKAIEDIYNMKIPDRGIFIRVIVGELSRAIDHLVCLAAGLLDMGAQTNYWYLFNPRSNAYDFLSRLTGARLTNSYMRVGGVAHDLHLGWENELEAVLKEIEKGVDESLRMTETNRIFQDRTYGISPVSAQDAISYGFTGPNLRASGVAYDLRFDKPYDYYDTFDFELVVGTQGDTYDRLMVRFFEIKESLKIIRQAMRKIPQGAISVGRHDITLPPKRSVYNSIEGMMNQFKLIFDGIHVPKGEYY
ncbi:MAG: NADH-quinone oxidoreductase subunit D, partial [Campylobacterales bacterium]|nr:NADH-quinone oxidoreductase subunit D [Campylobacterales bacterium]